MGTTATIIAISYLIAVLISAAAALAVRRSTRLPSRGVDATRLARGERTWLWVVAALLLALLLATISFTPYGASAPRERQVVRVTGAQFAWVLEPAAVKANVPVEFELRSADVSHAFAVYDKDGVLLFQVQVMPGKTQRALYTFREPGVYRILCLEFCGFAHELMTGTLKVTPS